VTVPQKLESPRDETPTATADPQAAAPRRWTLHGLNNGLIFSATYRGVRTLPRAISYAIGHVGTWIAWRTMTRTREAIADNLAAVFPGESRPALERRALHTLRSYARDVIDFLRALGHATANPARVFELDDAHARLFARLRARGKGIILVTGHFGNWEIGSMLIGNLLRLPLTIVAMTEADPDVNRIRLEIRDLMGAETIEVRQSLDTPLQIRRCLADNRIVAMLVDRHYGRDRIGVMLFGRPAWLLRTPFLMAQVTGAPLLPCSIERIGAERFRAFPGEPVFVATDIPRDDALRRAAQEVAAAIEARVRAHPEYWYHFYRYWDAQRDEYDGLA
jgi:lauroyl/myristoyl acyltransferase